MKKTITESSGIPLSDVQRRALLNAYAEGYALYEDVDPESGFKKATIQSLLKAGLIEHDPDDKEDVAYRATPAGRAALGIRLEPRPRGFKAAVWQGIRTIFPEDIADEIEMSDYPPKVRKGSTLTVYVPPMPYNDVDPELLWMAVETLVREWGWPVGVDTATTDSSVLVEWLDEEQ